MIFMGENPFLGSLEVVGHRNGFAYIKTNTYCDI